MNLPTFQAFQTQAEAQGFDEVVERRWEPLKELGAHTHPFAVRALVVQGEMWLTIGSEATRHLGPGDEFTIDRGISHLERYGPEGATYWAARRHG
ncbi:MAG TPA: AraC family transcriptional regulator [Casimicrobiaceae bacterium]|nr:AraC family transcriptional regulator [Casimicrobiaceae bacterium]